MSLNDICIKMAQRKTQYKKSIAPIFHYRHKQPFFQQHLTAALQMTGALCGSLSLSFLSAAVLQTQSLLFSPSVPLSADTVKINDSSILQTGLTSANEILSAMSHPSELLGYDWQMDHLINIIYHLHLTNTHTSWEHSLTPNKVCHLHKWTITDVPVYISLTTFSSPVTSLHYCVTHKDSCCLVWLAWHAVKHTS